MNAITSERIQIARVARGWSRERLASESGLSYGSVIAWESRGSAPSAESIVALARALGVSSDYLLGLTDDMSPAAQTAET